MLNRFADALMGAPQSGEWSQRSQTSRNMCDFCGERPKNPGFNYCSRVCGQDAAKQATAYTSRTGSTNTGWGRTSGPTSWVIGSSGPVVPSRSDNDLCENCHLRPKREEKDRSGRITKHPFCGRTCADQAMKSNRCKLRDCTKPVSQGESYCSDSHSKKAVRNGEAPACPVCREMAVNPPFETCSKRCSLRLGDDGGGAGAGGGLLCKLDEHDPDAYEAIQAFTQNWRTNPPPRLAVHAIFDINLPKRYDKRFTESMQRADSLGGKQISVTYYGGQCLCDIGVSPGLSANVCNWPGCSICAVLRKGFDVLEFGALTNDGVYGPGIYTNRNPAHSHQFTVGKSTNPYRAIIVCHVVGTRDPSRTDKKLVVVTDKNGRVFTPNKENILPKKLIIYQTS